MKKKTTRPNKVRDLVRGKAPTPTPQPEPVAITQDDREVMVETDTDTDKELNAQDKALQQLRNSRRGRRPSTDKSKSDTDRHTFVIPRDVIRKIKYIALVETRLYSNVVQDALATYIDDYEKTNGVITIKKTED